MRLLSQLHLGMAAMERFPPGKTADGEVFTAYNLLIRSWNDFLWVFFFFSSSATLVTDYFQTHQIHRVIFKMQSGHPHTHL